MSTSHTLNVTSKYAPSGSGDKTWGWPWTHGARLQWAMHQHVNYCPKKSESWDKRSSVRPLAQTSCALLCKPSPLIKKTTDNLSNLISAIFLNFFLKFGTILHKKECKYIQSRTLVHSHAPTFLKLQFESKLYRWSQLYLAVFNMTISIFISTEAKVKQRDGPQPEIQKHNQQNVKTQIPNNCRWWGFIHKRRTGLIETDFPVSINSNRRQAKIIPLG